MPRHKTYLVLCIVSVDGEIKEFHRNIEVFDINSLMDTFSYMYLEAKRIYKTEILPSDIITLLFIYKDTVVKRLPESLKL